MGRFISLTLAVAVTAIVFVAGPLTALHSLQAQQTTAWAVRVEAGRSSSHGSDEGLGGALRAALPTYPDDKFRFDLGLVAGPPYGGLETDVELRVGLRRAVTLLLRGGGGLLLEDGFTGVFGRVGGGLEFTVQPRLAVRITHHLGTHGGSSGPHLTAVGLEYRFLRERARSPAA